MKNSKIRKQFYAERSEAKKNTEILKRALKTSILGPQNLGSGGGARAPEAPALDPHLVKQWKTVASSNCQRDIPESKNLLFIHFRQMFSLL